MRLVRERLVRGGAGSLGDEELLGVLVGEKAEGLLEECGSLHGLADKGFGALRVAAGLGSTGAATLAAALELGRRVAAAEASNLPNKIASNEDVIDIFRPQLAALSYEEFWVLFLSGANTVVGREKIGQGGVAGGTVDHRIVVKRAVELLASAIILVHNHPTGMAEPSGEDGAITRRIVEAASLFDIAVVDHLILTSGGAFSFRHANLL